MAMTLHPGTRCAPPRKSIVAAIFVKQTLFARIRMAKSQRVHVGVAVDLAQVRRAIQQMHFARELHVIPNRLACMTKVRS